VSEHGSVSRRGRGWGKKGPLSKGAAFVCLKAGGVNNGECASKTSELFSHFLLRFTISSLRATANTPSSILEAKQEFAPPFPRLYIAFCLFPRPSLSQSDDIKHSFCWRARFSECGQSRKHSDGEVMAEMCLFAYYHHLLARPGWLTLDLPRVHRKEMRHWSHFIRPSTCTTLTLSNIVTISRLRNWVRRPFETRDSLSNLLWVE